MTRGPRSSPLRPHPARPPLRPAPLLPSPAPAVLGALRAPSGRHRCTAPPRPPYPPCGASLCNPPPPTPSKGRSPPAPRSPCTVSLPSPRLCRAPVRAASPPAAVAPRHPVAQLPPPSGRGAMAPAASAHGWLFPGLWARADVSRRLSACGGGARMKWHVWGKSHPWG